MWVWVGPRWMRPGRRFSRVMWFVSLPVAVFMNWFGWTWVGPGSTGGGVAFLVVWTAGIIAIEVGAMDLAVDQSPAHDRLVSVGGASDVGWELVPMPPLPGPRERLQNGKCPIVPGGHCLAIGGVGDPCDSTLPGPPLPVSRIRRQIG